MHLVSLEVKGLKSLRDTKIEALGHYNVFIGRNNAGKSAILQALRLLSPLEPELDLDRAREILTDRPQAGRMRLSATFMLSDLELDQLPGAEELRGRAVLGRVDHWRYDMEMRVGHELWPEPQLYVTACGPTIKDDYAPLFRLPHPDNPSQWEVLRPPDFDRVLKLDSRRIGSQVAALQGDPWRTVAGTPLKARNPGRVGQAFLWPLGEFVKRLSFLDSGRSAGDESALVETRTLEARGGNLTAVVETFLSAGGSEFGTLEHLIRHMFPDVATVRAPTEGEHKVLRIAMGEQQDSARGFRLSETGMGLQQAIMVATGVVAARQGSAILIEEPENTLHPGAQRELADWLRKEAVENDKQILISTHSTIFASTEKHCSTYLVRLDKKEGTKVTNLKAADHPLVKQELGIRNVDLYGYNGVVLWEGDSEAQAMPVVLDVLAEKAGTSVHALGLTSRNLYGHTNMRLQGVRQFLGLLDDLDVVPYVVLDDDEDVREELHKLVQDGLLREGHYHVWEQGRKMHSRNPGVGCEFEDNFSSEQLIEAARSVAADSGVSVELDAAVLAKRCAEFTTKTSDVLCKYYHEVTDYGLSKPDLARKLAALVAPELRGQAERSVKEYEFEKVASDIFTKLGGMR